MTVVVNQCRVVSVLDAEPQAGSQTDQSGRSGKVIIKCYVKRKLRRDLVFSLELLAAGVATGLEPRVCVCALQAQVFSIGISSEQMSVFKIGLNSHKLICLIFPRKFSLRLVSVLLAGSVHWFV